MNYIQKYKKHHNIGEQDIVLCECGRVAVDIHHKKFKSQGGTDDINNLVALCRECHKKAHHLCQKHNLSERAFNISH